MTDTAQATTSDAVAEVTAWLEENWDPELTVAEWWERLGISGWAAPSLPTDSYGKGLVRSDSVQVQRTIASFGALGAPGGLGLLLAAPTIAMHGDDSHKQTLIKDIVTGQRAWCQLFSEPNAGSDLAGLQCRAEKDGDEWIVTGQKVWTSAGHVADLGMLIARTDPDAPKHTGITYFAIDMHQPGIEIRPLKEMTGRALFNEVFLDEARVPDSAIIGGLNNGWAVANATLAFERAGLGAGGGSAAGGLAMPGTIAGDLDKPAGDFVSEKRTSGQGGGSPASMFGAAEQLLTELAKHNGKIDQAPVRQRLMELHTLNEIARYTNLRMKGGQDVPGIGNIAKLSMSRILKLSRDLGFEILGPAATLHGYTGEQGEALKEAGVNPLGGMVTEMGLFSPGPSIYGGTDEVQHNVIGERVLGLPKEPNQFKTTAFKDLPKNG